MLEGASGILLFTGAGISTATLGVYPAASIPLMAAGRGAPYVIVNRGETEQDAHTGVTLRLEGSVDKLFAPACRAVCA